MEDVMKKVLILSFFVFGLCAQESVPVDAGDATPAIKLYKAPSDVNIYVKPTLGETNTESTDILIDQSADCTLWQAGYKEAKLGWNFVSGKGDCGPAKNPAEFGEYFVCPQDKEVCKTKLNDLTNPQPQQG